MLESDDESDYTIEMTTTSPGIPFVQVPGKWSEVLEFVPQILNLFSIIL